MILQTIVFLKKLLRLTEKARPNSKLMKTGIIPDTEDDRDFIFEPIGTSSFAKEIDLRPYVKEIKQQGRWNSCISHAICSCVEIQLTIQKPQTFMSLSERYNYYYGRIACGFSPSKNVGMYPRNAIKSAFDVGIAPEITCSYRENMSSEPTQMAKIMANLYKQRLGNYQRIYNEEGMKECLNDLKPFLIVCPIYSYWTNGGIGKDGIIRTPTGRDKETGYHAMTCIGYNEKGWILLNSWNCSWGDRGIGYLPYDYIINDRWLIELN